MNVNFELNAEFEKKLRNYLIMREMFSGSSGKAISVMAYGASLLAYVIGDEELMAVLRNIRKEAMDVSREEESLINGHNSTLEDKLRAFRKGYVESNEVL